MDHDENTYNILVLGPTGAGKSHLINTFFNQRICEDDVSHLSVTREVCFIKGEGNVYNPENQAFENRNVVVADTVGLCDTEWTDEQIFDLIEARVSCNFRHIDAIFVVFRADRLQKEHVENIKRIMSWLNYSKNNNHLRFLFVGTHAENLDDKKKSQLRSQAINILGIIDSSEPGDSKYNPVVYVGFPPEDTLNEMGKDRVRKSWDLLQPLLQLKKGKALDDYHKVMVKKFNTWKKLRIDLWIPNPFFITKQALARAFGNRCAIL